MCIAILITAHNRKSKTLTTLNSLFAQALPTRAGKMVVYLVDDGSTDGTSEAVAGNFPQVIILTGNGQLFWNGGMRMAFEAAMCRCFDYYLWLNDDTLLYPDAIDRLFETSLALGSGTIVVGSTQNPDTGSHTYGGVRRSSRWNPLKFGPVLPGNTPLPVATMNGNCVLIPANVAHTVGNLDSAFTHAIGDFDYGLRARKLGFDAMIVPGYVGTCKRNDRINTWQDPSLSVFDRWRKVRTPHGFPPLEWAIYSRRHGGFFWMFYWGIPYLQSLVPKRGTLDVQ